MAECEILDHGTPVFTAPGFTFGTDGLLLARFSQPGPWQRAAATKGRLRRRRNSARM